MFHHVLTRVFNLHRCVSAALASGVLTISIPTLAMANEPTAEAQAARDYIEATTEEVLDERGRDLEVTSRHRDDSEAHQRGAIDYRSKDLDREERHEEAREVSNALGPRHQVIVEEVHRTSGGVGPSAQQNTTYQDGEKGATRWGPTKATETHTHVQPGRAQMAR